MYKKIIVLQQFLQYFEKGNVIKMWVNNNLFLVQVAFATKIINDVNKNYNLLLRKSMYLQQFFEAVYKKYIIAINIFNISK